MSGSSLVEMSPLVAMAPLNEPEIRLFARFWNSHHPESPQLTLTIKEHLMAVQQEFDQEWAPIKMQLDDSVRKQAIEIMCEERLRYARKQYFNAWEPIIVEAGILRDRAYKETLLPIIRRERKLTSKWLVIQLGECFPLSKDMEQKEISDEEEEKGISQQALWRWRERGLLLNNRYGQPDFDSVTSLFMMRLLRPGLIKGFLPPGNYKGQPVMYCYRKDSPDSPIIPCGLPLDSNREQVPKHAMLFSPLSSLSKFHPDWLDYEGWSVRWAGTTLGENGNFLWDLSEEEIALWDPEIRAYQRKIMGAVQFARHTLASITLLACVSQLIDQMPAYRFPNLSFSPE
jgi:hypothetical protein